MSGSTTPLAIGAENTFTEGLLVGVRSFNVSIYGTFVGTVTLQRSFDDGVSYRDVQTYTAAAEDQFSEVEEGVLYRIGVKTGDYTSGTINVRLGV